jgi:nitronate monooxygenase
MWPDRRITDLFGIELPIIQAPMTTATTPDLVVAVSEAGGLGSLPFGAASPKDIQGLFTEVRQRTTKPINANFFCHTPPRVDRERGEAWHSSLAPYYREFGLDADTTGPELPGGPFDEAQCALVEEFRPEVVSFHFGIPDSDLLARVKGAGAKVIASATTVEEARWLEAHGCDAIIAQGSEAGGHRGIFLTEDLSTQVGTFALIPQIVDAVGVPVIATGGVTDARGIAAAMMLGAAAAQLGTAYLFCPEAKVSPLHREALQSGSEHTVLTNVLTGRAARAVVNRITREIGPISAHAPGFPLALSHLLPLAAAAEVSGSSSFSTLWAGQGAPLGKQRPAGELTTTLAREALALLSPQ